ncbi:hypothetical protein [Acidocella sp.]|uniref:hypothetical protein n=1 Tax=Acidocella sp. TaxID=50710 RepID=UPI0017D8FF0F|nr:hypothetical protein [Acidocella sp.]NNM56153.1 hypothetical protein [Acidocella sp.]
MKQFLSRLDMLATPRQWLRRPVCGVAFLAALSALATPAICLAKVSGLDLISPAAVTNLTALPDSAIAVITGTGLKAPSLSGTGEPRAAITLWDELRPAAQQSTLSNSNSTITVNGVVQ